jgi:hypothetical protein
MPDIGDSKQYNTCHVDGIKSYVDPRLDYFPKKEHHRPTISPAVQYLNLDVEKIIVHARLRNDVIRFMYKWSKYLTEDAIFKI